MTIDIVHYKFFLRGLCLRGIYCSYSAVRHNTSAVVKYSEYAKIRGGGDNCWLHCHLGRCVKCVCSLGLLCEASRARATASIEGGSYAIWTLLALWPLLNPTSATKCIYKQNKFPLSLFLQDVFLYKSRRKGATAAVLYGARRGTIHWETTKTKKWET